MKPPCRARLLRSVSARSRRPRTFDRLEDRTLLSGNLVLVDEVPGRLEFNLQQYTQAGTLVSSVPIPQPAGQTEYQEGRGVTVDTLGKIDLIDGTSQPYLSTYTPSTQNWSHQTFAGWAIGGNISYGMVESLGRYIYASNQGTAGGIVRFDTAGGPTTAFAPGKSFEQLTVGQDGLIYGLGYDNLFDQVAYGYDPATFNLVRSVTLPQKSSSADYYRSIAVDSAGEVFAAAWDDGRIYKFDPTGKTIEAQIQAPGQFGAGENLMSIALDTDGQIAVGGRFGEIYLTNESLASLQTIQTGQWQAFVTFDHYINVKPPTAPTFSALAAPTIAYGTATTTLSGQISDNGSIPPGSVNITVNGVTESAPIAATTGDFSASFDTSKLGVSSSPYTITYDYPGSGTIPAAQDTSKSLTVTPRALTVTANDASKTYGDSDPAFSAAYSGFAAGENASVLTGTLTFATNEPSGNAPVGTYTITPGGLSSANYTITFSPGTLSVTARALTIKANDATKTYGDPDPAFSVSYTGLATGDSASSLSGTLGFTTNEPAGNAPVGTYAITPSGLSSSNYTITFVSGTLNVTTRALTVTANDATKTYGEPDPAFGASYSGFAPGDNAGVLGGTLSFSTNEPAGNAPVGKYSITPSGLTSTNYTIAFVPGTLNVTARALTITANDASKVYGDSDPSFSANESGFAPGEGAGVLTGTLVFTTNEPAGNAPVGTYSITPSGLSSTNYTISFVNGTLSVTPRALTVTANDASKVYGDADPSFSASYSGFAQGETAGVLSGSLSFATNEPSGNAPVGKYTITPSGLSSTNYTIAFVPGTLSVTPRALTVTANDASKTFGQADPAFAATGSGFAPGENLANLGGTLVFTTTEPNPLTAPVGTYAITPSGLTSPNYTVTFAPGTLTINQAQTSFAGIPSPTVPIGSTTVSLSAQLRSNSVLPVGQSVTVTVLGSSGVLTTGSGVIQSDGSFTAVVNTGSLPMGTYTVQYSYAGDHNFSAASATGTLTVVVDYAVKPLYDTAKPHHSGSTVPIKLEVDNASGQNVSSPDLVVSAVTLVDANGKRFPVSARGNGGNTFRYVNGSYQYNLDSSGLAPGTYSLLVSIGNDPVLHAVSFVIGE